MQDKYYYRNLSSEQQIQYRKLLDVLKRQDATLICAETDSLVSSFEIISMAIVLDNPELYAVNANEFKVEKTSLGVSKILLQYVCEKDEARKIAAVAEEKLAWLIDKNSKDNDMETITRIHDFFANEIKVDENASNTALGVWRDKEATSLGVSLAFKQALRTAGIESVVVYGTMLGENAEWLIVEIEGVNYHIDIASDIARTTGENVCHDYFLLSDEEIAHDHAWEAELQCHSQGINLLVHKTYFTSEIESLVRILAYVRDAGGPEKACYMQRKDKAKKVGSVKSKAPKVQSKKPKKPLEKPMSFKEAVGLIDLYLQRMDEQDIFYAPIEKISGNLAMIKEIGRTSEESGQFVELAMETLPDLVGILDVYEKGKNLSVKFSQSELVEKRLLKMLEDFSVMLHKRLYDFYSEKQMSLLEQINSIVLEDEAKDDILERIPFDIDNLTQQASLDEYITAWSYMEQLFLPDGIQKKVARTVELLGKLKKTVEAKKDMDINIDIYTTYYLPEALKLLVQYLGYIRRGIDDMSIQELSNSVADALNVLCVAIDDKIKEVHMYDVMLAKAEAAALTTVLESNGFVRPERRLF